MEVHTDQMTCGFIELVFKLMMKPTASDVVCLVEKIKSTQSLPLSGSRINGLKKIKTTKHR